VRLLGPLVNALDTTEGCIGVASDADIAWLARSVVEHPRATVLVR
jgi:hypothetical protein